MFRSLLLSLLVLTLLKSGGAFVVVTPRQFISSHSKPTTSRLQALPNALAFSFANVFFPAAAREALVILADGDTDVVAEYMASDNTAVATVSVDATATDIGFDDAFTDQINLLDGPIKIMLGVFVGVVAILAVLAVLSSKVDDAINQTLQDYEATLRQYYPQRWEAIEARLAASAAIQSSSSSSSTTAAEAKQERDIELFKIMDEMQQQEPELMEQVRQRMDR